LLEFNDYDHGAIEEFVLFALDTEQNLRGYLRGYRSDFRQLLRRLARDFHHQIRDFTPPVHQVGPTALPRDARDDIISEAAREIRDSPFYQNNQVLGEYLIRILHQVGPHDFLPISMLLCPHTYTVEGTVFNVRVAPHCKT